MMVRSEVMRGRFRNSFSKPEPFVANKKTAVNIKLQDVMHTFKRDIKSNQIQSTWFPLIDLNPQTFVTISFMQNQKILNKHNICRF
jgi:predicted acyl esterase